MATARQTFLALGLAAAAAVPAVLAASMATPASAQVSVGVSIGYDNFRGRLAPYGTWSHHPRWGEVWRPRAGAGFRPYYDGHWVNTREYGWLWVANEKWGDVPYHYGRWVYDAREGWLWVPGYVWAPSWVVWRSGGGNIGWFPMPPGDNYYGDGAYRDNFNSQYGYRAWNGPGFGATQFLALWVFVAEAHFGDRDFHSYTVPQQSYGRFISQTRDSTNYATVNNYVVNRSIDDSRLQRDTRQRFQPVAASSVLGRTALVTQATVGRQVEQRERQQHPAAASASPALQRGPAPNPAPKQPKAAQPARGVDARGAERGPASKPVAQRQQPSPQAGRNAPSPQAQPQARVKAPKAAQPVAGNGNARGPDRGPVPKAEAQQPSPRAQRDAPAAGRAPAASRASDNQPGQGGGQGGGKGGAKKADARNAPNDQKSGKGRGQN